MRVPALLLVCCLALLPAGCGSDSQTKSEQEARQAAARQARIAAERQQLRRQHRAEARARREAARRKVQREAARRQAREERAQAEAEERERAESKASEEASECDPNYSGACLDPYASDYDCEGGSGDGPEYTGPVTVVGEDHYGLDSDNDGYACEY
jgi:FKBP-type peptidyl-prolyl cis-trans isomerase